MNPVTLFRPVGESELALIRQSGWMEFPPRLPEQPIFYPVLDEQYAAQIARDWNVKASRDRAYAQSGCQVCWLGAADVVDVRKAS